MFVDGLLSGLALPVPCGRVDGCRGGQNRKRRGQDRGGACRQAALIASLASPRSNATIFNDACKRLPQGEAPEARADPDAGVPVSFQCPALGLARSTWYADKGKPRPKERLVTEHEDALTSGIDTMRARMPYPGARITSARLKDAGHVRRGRSAAARLTKATGIRATHREPKTGPLQGPSAFPLSVGQHCLHVSEPGAGNRHHAYPAGQAPCVPTGDCRCAFTVCVLGPHDALEAGQAVAAMRTASAAHGIPSIMECRPRHDVFIGRVHGLAGRDRDTPADGRHGASGLAMSGSSARSGR